MMYIFIENHYKDPYLNNQDSMESKRFFFRGSIVECVLFRKNGIVFSIGL